MKHPLTVLLAKLTFLIRSSFGLSQGARITAPPPAFLDDNFLVEPTGGRVILMDY